MYDYSRANETSAGLLIMFFLYVLTNAFVFGIIAFQITIWFRRGFGWVVFVTLFPFALMWLLAAGKRIGEDSFKRCPMCRELVHWEAELCPHCSSDQFPERRVRPAASMTDSADAVKDQVIITSICPSCKSINATDSTHCFQCGKELK